MVDDDYEILPHRELEYLRHEVEKLKKSPYGDTETGETLLDSMNNLTTSINRLLAVLETANEELIRDYEDNKTSQRVERLTEQNEKLAVGIVAIGELIKEVLTKNQQDGGLEALESFTQQHMPKPDAARDTGSQSPFGDDDIPSVSGLPPPPKDTPVRTGMIDDVPLPPR